MQWMVVDSYAPVCNIFMTILFQQDCKTVAFQVSDHILYSACDDNTQLELSHGRLSLSFPNGRCSQIAGKLELEVSIVANSESQSILN
jgi:hypothetical protein